MDTFSYPFPINLSEGDKWLLAVTNFEAMNSLFIMTDEYDSFSVLALGFWTPKSVQENIDKLNELLELRSQKDIELHVKAVAKRGIRKEIGNRRHNLADFDIFISEILPESTRVKNKDLEDMVYGIELMMKL